jgi:hypothetical protein
MRTGSISAASAISEMEQKSAAGCFDAARDILVSAFGASACDVSKLSNREFTELVIFSIALKDWNVLGKAVRDRFSLPVRPSFLIEERGAETWSVVRWSMGSSRSTEFGIASTVGLNERGRFFANKFIAVLKLIAVFMRTYPTQEGIVSLNLDDNAVTGGLAFCSSRDDSFLIPDDYFISTSGYKEIRSYLIKNPLPWRDRKPIAFWRGATTGCRIDGNWQSLPRIRLCQLAQGNSSIFDVGISKIVQTKSDGEVIEIERSGFCRDRVPQTEMFKYKLLIDIDGNTNSWPGLFTKLLGGSAVLKVESPKSFRQWYYPHLRPWDNFVPISKTMEDIEDKVLWLLKRDYVMEDIANNSARLAASMDFASQIDEGIRTIAAAFRKSSYG